MYARYLRFKSLHLKFKYHIKTKQKKNCFRDILRNVLYIIELIFNQAEMKYFKIKIKVK